MVFKGKQTDETVAFVNNDTPCVGSPEDTVKFYTLGDGSPNNKVKDFALMGVSLRDNV